MVLVVAFLSLEWREKNLEKSKGLGCFQKSRLWSVWHFLKHGKYAKLHVGLDSVPPAFPPHLILESMDEEDPLLPNHPIAEFEPVCFLMQPPI